MKFKNVDDYLNYWNQFFESWKEDKAGTFQEDEVWCDHPGKGDKKLNYDLLPQPYLGDIKNHSVITLNLNPCRTKEKAEEFKENQNNFNNADNYYEYAKEFPTYDIKFWQKQKKWFERMGYSGSKKPFAIEICPWNSKSWKALKIDQDIVDYLDKKVFDVVEKAIKHSDIKMVFSVGKAYYDIFKESGFEAVEELSNKSDEKFILLKSSKILKENQPYLKLQEKEEEKTIKTSKIPLHWPSKEKSNCLARTFVNRNFSIWKRNDTFYFNTWASGSNNPPAARFDNILEDLLKKYINLYNDPKNTFKKDPKI